jgi:ribosomal protein S17E
MQDVNTTVQQLNIKIGNVVQDSIQTLAKVFVKEYANVLDSDDYTEVAEDVMRELVGEMYNDDLQSDFDYYTNYYTEHAE